MGMGTEIPFPRQPCKDPCDPTRNLILFFDIVHITKSIRNN